MKIALAVVIYLVVSFIVSWCVGTYLRHRGQDRWVRPAHGRCRWCKAGDEDWCHPDCPALDPMDWR